MKTSSWAGYVSMALVSFALGSTSTWSAENGVVSYPAGSAGVLVGTFPPIPGLFAVSQTSYSWANGLYDGSGRKLPVHFSVSAVAETMRFLASWPTELLGARLYSQLVVPVAHVRTTTPGGPHTADGLANLTISPLILNWRLGETQSFTLGFDISPNTGTYSARKALNVGPNYTSVAPTIAYNFRHASGFEFAVSPRLVMTTSANDDSVSPGAPPVGRRSYRTGDAFVADYSLGYNIGPWKVGVVGGYVNQYTDDTFNGQKAFSAAGIRNGNRLRSFSIGPSVAYDCKGILLNVNWQQTVSVANGTKGGVLWAVVAFPLWMPGPTKQASLAP